MSKLLVAVDGRLANEAEPAGVGRYTAGMLRGLRTVAPEMALRIYLDAPPRAEFPLASDEAEIRVLPRKAFWTHRILGPALRKERCDVFLSPLTQLPHFCPLPAVAVIHDLAYYDYGEHFTWRQRLIAQMQTRYVVGRATMLAADSEATRQDVLARFKLAPQRVRVTLAGVDERFRPAELGSARLRLAEKYGIEGPYLLYVGRLQPRKNLVRLMEAFDQLKTARPACPHRLVIAGGSGWMMEGIAAAKRNAVHGDAIHFPGRIDEEDLPALYTCADIFLLVSLWEGFGLPVLEAMACGTPVITANCSSLPEVAGDFAVLVDPCDTKAIAQAIASLLDDASTRECLQVAGQARAREFSWEAAATKLAKLLYDAAEKK